MKRLILALLAAVIMATAAAQTYNMEVSLKNGNKITVAADSVSEVRFVKVTTSPEDVFNILTEEYIPDPVLRDSIRSQVAKGAETLTNIAAAKYTGKLELFPESGLSSLQGIQFLSGLRRFYMGFSEVENVDLSSLKELTTIYLWQNYNMSSINIKGLEKLDSLTVAFSRLAEFDCKSLPKSMKYLSIMAAGLQSMELPSLPNLENLQCPNNKLTTINLNSVPALTTFEGTSNDFQSLDFSSCPNLSILIAGSNQNLTNVNIDGCHCLKTIALQNSSLSSIDLQYAKSTLEILNLSNTRISTVNLSGCTTLSSLQLNATSVENVDLSSCISLETIRVEDSPIKSLDISVSPGIKYIHCYNVPKLQSIKLAPSLPLLCQLNCWDAPNLKNFEWGQTESLGYVNINRTGLTRIDISKVNKSFNAIGLSENSSLKEIKVWEGFDMANPPENILKDQNAKFVYEFTQE